MNELISVIIPFYNVEKYARKCIESIINQSYKNLEIILVDDGSPDKCGEICDEYAKKDKRIKVIHKENGGLSDARNTGISNATGKYIGFVDSDDYIEIDMYEYLYKLLKENDADISMCGVQSFYESEKIKVSNIKEDIEVFNSESAIKELLIDKKITSHAWNKLYKKELFDNIKYPVGRKMEDIATTYKLFYISKKIVSGKEKKYYYLQRNNGIMGSNSTSMWIDYYELSLDRYYEINKFYPNMNVNKIKILQLIADLYMQDNMEVKNYLKENKVFNIYKNIFDMNLLKEVDKKTKIKLILMRINKKIYKVLFKLYIKLKNKKSI